MHIGNPPVIGNDGIIYGYYESPDLATVPMTPAGEKVEWTTTTAVVRPTGGGPGDAPERRVEEAAPVRELRASISPEPPREPAPRCATRSLPPTAPSTRAGLVTLAFGNVSGVDRDAGVLVIKPSGIPCADVRADDLVAVALDDGRVVEGDLRPSTDTPTHRLLYLELPRTSAASSIPTRRHASAWAQAGRPDPGLGTTHADYFRGPVLVTRHLSRRRDRGRVRVGHRARHRRDGPRARSDGRGLAGGPRPVARPVRVGRVAGRRGRGTPIALEEIATIAWQTLSASTRRRRPSRQELLHRHFDRKHGATAYYGQRPGDAEATPVMSYAIGVDFGTESGRAVVVDVATGAELATASTPTPTASSTSTCRRPTTTSASAPDWALQDPDDYIAHVPARRSRPCSPRPASTRPTSSASGIDFTACTMLPTTADGTPLCRLPELRREPHAWVKLWKHHAAQPEADRINARRARARRGVAAALRRQDLVGVVLREGLQILDEAPRDLRAPPTG